MNTKIKLSALLFFITIFGFFAVATPSPASAMTCNSATLNGTLTVNTPPVYARFEYSSNYSTVANGAGTQTQTQTFNSTGSFAVEQYVSGLSASTTYYFRLVITDFNGTNPRAINSFTTPACTPPPATNPTALVTASASTITSGNSVTVYWTSTNANYCTSSPNSWSGGNATSGHSILWPTQTTTYSVTCYGANGTTPATDSVTVTVNPVTPPVTNPTALITASSSTITAGNSSTLYWTSTNATSCTLSWNSGNHATYGSQAVWPTSTTTYTVDCVSVSGQHATDSLVVTVNPVTPPVTNPTAYLTASSSTITAGNSSTLYWTSTNATSCSANWNNGNSATSGSFAVWPTVTTNYSITCYGTSGTTPAISQVTVTVNPVTPPVNNPTALVTASASTITSGNSVTVYWTSTNANYCTSSPNSWSGGNATSGHSILWPTQTTTYSVTCYGASGTTPATDSVVVTVTQPNQGSPLSCSGPTSVTAGTTATFSASGGTSPYNWSEGNNTFNGTVWNLFIPSWYSGQKIAHLYDAAGGNDDCVFNVIQNQTTQNPTVSLTANPVSIQNGQNSTLTWISQNATWCSSYWTSSTATSGSGVVVPTTTTTYSVTCYGASGTNPATAQATVYVNQNPPNNNPTAQLTADSLSVNYGGSTTLRWNSTYTSYCDTSVTAGGASGWNGRKGTSGTFPTGALTATATYYLSCMGTNGQLANDSLTITVGNPPATPSGHLLVSPSSCVISAGQSTCTVTGATWNTSNVNDPRLFDRNTGALLSTLANNYSPLTVWVAYPYTTFDLKNGSTVLDTKVANASCTSGTTWNGNICAQNQVQNPTVSITANPMSVSYNGTSVISWTSANATSCIGNGGSNGWSGSKNLSGTFSTGALTNTTSYSIICTNSSGQSAVDSVTVSVGNQNQNPTVNITANPISIQMGQSSILSWSSANANSCTTSTGNSGTSGNQTVYPSVTTNYSITCYGNNGTQATDQVTVYVNQVQNQTCQDPSANNYGGLLPCTYYNQICQDVNAINYRGSLPCRYNTYNYVCQDPSAINYRGTLPCQYNTYIYTCQDTRATNYGSILPCRYNIYFDNRPTVGIAADSTDLAWNRPTNIRWYTTNATSCYASDGSFGWAGVKSIGPGSFYTGSLTSSKVYTITCTNAYGSATDSVRVNVRGQVINPVTPVAPTSYVIINSSVDRNQPIVPTIDNTRPHPGDQINYTVSYQNIGNASITGLTLRITLPYEVDYMFSTPNNPVITGNVLTFNLGTLKANGQGSVTVRVRVKDNTPLGTVLNFPAVLSYTDPSGNIQSVSANVTAQVWSGDVNTDNSINRNTDNNINLGANVFGAGFWPSNLFGWLIFLVLLLLLILLILYIYEKIRNSRTAKKTPSAPKPVMVKKTTTTTTTPQQ